MAGIKPTYTSTLIPVDYRNALLALVSCIIEDCANSKTLEECAAKLTGAKYARTVQEAWTVICSNLDTPCLVLNTFTWLFMGKAVRARFSPAINVELFKRDNGIEIPANAATALLECTGKYNRLR